MQSQSSPNQTARAQIQSCQTTSPGLRPTWRFVGVWLRLVGPFVALRRGGLLPAKHPAFFYKTPILSPPSLPPSSSTIRQQQHPEQSGEDLF